MDAFIGKKLGQYEVISRLGAGGMATVYRARQTSVERDVAIKLIRADMINDEQFGERFRREAKTIATLSHPHILKVFDYGQEGNVAYLVMELLEGGSLAHQLRHEGPLPAARASRMLDQVASALDYAHQMGIIHRDLKPDNVLLDRLQNAFLTDFGIAKLLNESTNITRTGMMMGTPAYMAPELWSGERADARSDIYALGIILYEMLAGKTPYTGDTPFAMMHMHIYEAPPSIYAYNPGLPNGADLIFQRALAKERTARFSSAQQMADAFRNLITTGIAPVANATDLTSPLPAVEGVPSPTTSGQARIPTPSAGVQGRSPTPVGMPQPGAEASVMEKPRRGGAAAILLAVAALAILGVVGLLAITNNNNNNASATIAAQDAENTRIALIGSATETVVSTETSAASATSSQTPTSTSSPTPTSTVTPNLSVTPDPSVIAQETANAHASATANQAAAESTSVAMTTMVMATVQMGSTNAAATEQAGATSAAAATATTVSNETMIARSAAGTLAAQETIIAATVGAQQTSLAKTAAAQETVLAATAIAQQTKVAAMILEGTVSAATIQAAQTLTSSQNQTAIAIVAQNTLQAQQTSIANLSREATSAAATARALQTVAAVQNATAMAIAALSTVQAQQTNIAAIQMTAAARVPTATPTVVVAQCPNFTTSRLRPNTAARITPGDPNRLRTEPGGGDTISNIPGNAPIYVLDGPKCTTAGNGQGLAWWYVEYNDGSKVLRGWTAEGQGNQYWIAPADLSEVSAPYPTGVCTTSPAARVKTGGWARVLLNSDIVFLNSKPARSSIDSSSVTTARISAGGEFRVISEAVCNHGITWWQANYRGLVGWIGESDSNGYWIEPISAPSQVSNVTRVPATRNPNATAVPGGKTPTADPKAPPPYNQRGSIPAGAVILGNGEFQVESYCSNKGYVAQLNPNKTAFVCTEQGTGVTVFTLVAKDYDLICQAFYGNPNAFALQVANNPVPAYNWRCYVFP
ncbi:MAG: protein kinase [Anaerolineae bacterium]|nr:protein kinase [Anaerolineae bacterium]